jgi:putative ABC transport system permease protein
VSNSAIYESANHVLIVVSIALVCLAVICTTFTTWATVVDTRVAAALARALGATPGQLSAGTTAAQLIPALAAACLGVPLGLLLYQMVGGNLNTATPPIWALLAIVPATLLGVALATAIPARVGARQPVAEVLRTD